jgi:hypothetical protein
MFSDFWGLLGEFILQQSLVGALLILFGASLKVIGTSVYNAISSKKIIHDIQKNYKVKQVIQRSENSRLIMGANRVIITQLHNGGKWSNGQSMIKLSMIQDLSIEDPHGKIMHKSFDKHLNNVLLSQITPLIAIASSKKNYDIISVGDLKDKDFPLYRVLKIDKISYLIVSKIQYKHDILGYIFVVFTDKFVPDYNKDSINTLIQLGIQVGEILK